jgi:branched-chain amino acid transport system substrate-binding protein
VVGCRLGYVDVDIENDLFDIETDLACRKGAEGGNVTVHTRGRKATLAIITALALTGVAACGSDDDSDGATETTDATTDATDAPADTTDATDAPADTTDATDAPEGTDAPEAGGLGEPNEATGEPITIGFVSDGENAAFGSDENLVATFESTIEYANEYLGGLNGRPIEIEHCDTGATPAGGTQCAVQLASAGVAAALVPVSSQDGAIFEGLAGSGIPYFTYTSANGAITASPGSYLQTNPISQIAVPGLLAQEQGIDKLGFIIIDVPAATGPITAIAEPIYANLGVELQIIPIAPSVADMTPQLQQAISGGAGMFAITGTEDFLINATNGLRQLGFEGPIFVGNAVPEVLAALTTFDNVFSGGAATTDPSDPDVQLMETIVETYAGLDPELADPVAFGNALGFVRALTGATDAVDAASITAALDAMPETDLPLGAGITFQCGTAPVSFAPAICSLDVLSWAFNTDGEQQDVTVVDIPDGALTLG